MQDEENGSGILSTWQEIADYLGVTPATAKKYHKRFGLPIARLGSDHHGRVHSTEQSIYEWMRGKVRRV